MGLGFRVWSVIVLWEAARGLCCPPASSQAVSATAASLLGRLVRRHCSGPQTGICPWASSRPRTEQLIFPDSHSTLTPTADGTRTSRTTRCCCRSTKMSGEQGAGRWEPAPGASVGFPVLLPCPFPAQARRGVFEELLVSCPGSCVQALVVAGLGWGWWCGECPECPALLSPCLSFSCSPGVCGFISSFLQQILRPRYMAGSMAGWALNAE